MTRRIKRICVLIALLIMIPYTAIAGFVFTIENTDKLTGESLGSMEIAVDGLLLKMTYLDSHAPKADSADEGGQGMFDLGDLVSGAGGGSQVDSTMESSGVAIASDSAADSVSVMDDSTVGSNASEREDASVITYSNTSRNAKDGEMTCNADRREMLVVDHESQEYFVMDEAFLATIGGNFGGAADQVSQVNGMMQQAYETAIAQLDAQNLTPQERAQAEQMLRSTFGISGSLISPDSTSGSSGELIKGDSDTVNGYPAVNYKLLTSGQKAKELWVTDWKELGVGAEAQDTFESYFNFFAEMSNSLGEKGFGSDSDLDFFETMDQIGGFPVFGQYFEGGDVDEEFSLDSVTERDLDPDAFEPPAGYTLRTMGGFFQ